jgi:hypothetical protein
MESEVKSSQKKATERESCRTCNFVLGVQAATEKLHCGLAYYQVPAIERRPEKLDNYSVVFADSNCTNWIAISK